MAQNPRFEFFFTTCLSELNRQRCPQSHLQVQMKNYSEQISRKLKHLSGILGVWAFSFSVAHAVIPYHQGFESDGSGWVQTTPVRVASGGGSLGLISASGNYHAEISGTTYSYLGGQTSVYPGAPVVQSIDLYIDTGWHTGTVGEQAQAFLITMAPAYSDQVIGHTPGTSNHGSGHQFDFRVNGEQVEIRSTGLGGGAQTIATITESGWYRFAMTFRPGELDTDPVQTDLSIHTLSGAFLGSQTRAARAGTGEPPHDTRSIALGGNSHIWFHDFDTTFLSTFGGVGVDNAIAVPEPAFYASLFGLLVLAIAWRQRRRRG